MRTSIAMLCCCAWAFPAAAQVQPAPPAAPKPSLIIRAAHLIDGVGGSARGQTDVLVTGERIVAVGDAASVAAKAPAGTKVLDLGDAWLLPGLIDAHTHALLQGDITQADYDVQLLKESLPYRAIGGTAAVRTALFNGFTAIRDLETEGAMYADVDLKLAIQRGVIPGPRMFVATRSFAPTGMYPLLGYAWDLQVPKGVQIEDTPDKLRVAVREQVGHGADWIKYYSDRRYYKTKDSSKPLRSWVNYTDEEAKAIVSEAHRLGRKVAAHAIGWDGIDSALRAGVDSIEHGDGLTDDLLERMADKGVAWCPTIYVGAYVAEGRGGIWPWMVKQEEAAFKKAMKKGVKIAYGTDAGGYAWTENQAKELSYMVRYGMSPMDAIKSATSVAAALLDPICPPSAETCAKSDLGSIEAGKYADLVAVSASPLEKIDELERVKFVMKGGALVKNELGAK